VGASGVVPKKNLRWCESPQPASRLSPPLRRRRAPPFPSPPRRRRRHASPLHLHPSPRPPPTQHSCAVSPRCIIVAALFCRVLLLCVHSYAVLPRCVITCSCCCTVAVLFYRAVSLHVRALHTAAALRVAWSSCTASRAALTRRAQLGCSVGASGVIQNKSPLARIPPHPQPPPACPPCRPPPPPRRLPFPSRPFLSIQWPCATPAGILHSAIPKTLPPSFPFMLASCLCIPPRLAHPTPHPPGILRSPIPKAPPPPPLHNCPPCCKSYNI
jgi:hypothetical protein